MPYEHKSITPQPNKPASPAPNTPPKMHPTRAHLRAVAPPPNGQCWGLPPSPVDGLAAMADVLAAMPSAGGSVASVRHRRRRRDTSASATPAGRARRTRDRRDVAPPRRRRRYRRVIEAGRRTPLPTRRTVTRAHCARTPRRRAVTTFRRTAQATGRPARAADRGASPSGGDGDPDPDPQRLRPAAREALEGLVGGAS